MQKRRRDLLEAMIDIIRSPLSTGDLLDLALQVMISYRTFERRLSARKALPVDNDLQQSRSSEFSITLIEFLDEILAEALLAADSLDARDKRAFVTERLTQLNQRISEFEM